MAKKGDNGGGQPKDPAKKLRKLIKNARVVMLTTMSGDGRLRTRPMIPGALQDGALWFLTSLSSAKTEEIADNQRVGLAYSAPKTNRYLSISGQASIVRDAGHVRDLWEREHKEWFKGGKNDPDLALLRVQIDHVEYWDADEGRMVPLSAQGLTGEGSPQPPRPPGNPPVSSGALG